MTVDQTEAALLKIARRYLPGVETLAEKRTGEDFHEVAVWGLRNALHAAFEAGRQSSAASK